MLHFFQSNDMSALTDIFGERSRLTQTDPFVPDTVVVQSYGTGQWLKLQTANKQGICANLQCLLPAHFIWELYRSILGQPQNSPLENDLLAWRLMSLFEPLGSEEPPFFKIETLEKEAYAPIRQYLTAGGDKDLRTYQLASSLADLYNQYLVYRPDWIIAWEKDEEPLAHNPHPWQATLWRQLISGEAELATSHRAFLHTRLIEKLAALQDTAGLPPHLSVFGLSSLPIIQLETFRALAEHIDVDIYFLNPCQHYWGDIVSEKQIAKRSIRQLIDKAGTLSDDDYLEVGNPLLASLGKQGREFLELILETDDINPVDLFIERPVINALTYLQNDIFALEYGGQFGKNIIRGQEAHVVADLKFESPVSKTTQESSAQKYLIESDDQSIQIHSCHSKVREIEILLDQILAILSAKPDLTPGDIIVMAPNITEYAPLIHSVFKDNIQFGIADRSRKDQSSFIASFINILELPHSRLTSMDLLDLLEVPAISRRFGLDEDALSTISYWIVESNIRWELNGESKSTRWQVPGIQQNTWCFGLDRLLLGIAVESTSGLVQQTLPVDVEAGEMSLLGDLYHFIQLIDHYRQELDKSQNAAAWQGIINQLLADFFDPDEDEALDLSIIQTLMQKMVDDSDTAGYATAFSGQLLHHLMQQDLMDTSTSMGFISGGITFATLVPMRSIPFSVVCLLGMNDREYPREDRSLSLNLMKANSGRKGDRSRRTDDRYLFLEAMLSAREIFYISFEGRSLKDNQIRPPSVLVSELLDYTNEVFNALEIVEHPLQPFSRKYYSKGNLSSFQQHWYEALIYNEPLTPFIEDRLPVQQDLQLVSIDQLKKFFSHPGKFFFQQCLGVYFGNDIVELQDTESFTLDHLERFKLADSALRAMVDGSDMDEWEGEMIASGKVMEGPVGALYLQRERKLADSIYLELSNYLKETRNNIQGEVIVGPVSLQGDVGYVEMKPSENETPENNLATDKIILNYRCGAIRSKNLIEYWINHLFASAAGVNIRSVNISKGNQGVDSSRFRHISQEQAIHHLDVMVRLYQEGTSMPLFLPPETAAIAVASMGKVEDPEKARKSALKTWADGYFPECDDPYWARLFPDSNAINEQFIEMAGLVYGSLAIAMAEDD